MNVKKVLPSEAAEIMGVSAQFVRVAMQLGAINIGTAIKMSSEWTYHISPKLLAEYTGKDIEKEVELIRKREGRL